MSSTKFNLLCAAIGTIFGVALIGYFSPSQTLFISAPTTFLILFILFEWLDGRTRHEADVRPVLLGCGHVAKPAGELDGMSLCYDCASRMAEENARRKEH